MCPEVQGTLPCREIFKRPAASETPSPYDAETIRFCNSLFFFRRFLFTASSSGASSRRNGDRTDRGVMARRHDHYGTRRGRRNHHGARRRNHDARFVMVMARRNYHDRTRRGRRNHNWTRRGNYHSRRRHYDHRSVMMTRSSHGSGGAADCSCDQDVFDFHFFLLASSWCGFPII